MSATDTPISLPRRPRRGLPAFRGWAWWILAVVMAVLTARLTMASIQLGCTLTLMVLAIGLYVRNRTAGLTVVWMVWLIAPFLRRVFLLSQNIQTAEPLALAPFLLTAAIIVLELSQMELSRRSRRLLMLAAGGYALGIPFGLLTSPQAAMFALFAYLTGLGCFAIGYREGAGDKFVLPNVLMVATPILALYAFRQYFLPLPEWDRIWQMTADINSVGSPDAGRIRVWSTLNSPGTFAVVLGVAALTLLTWRRLTPLRMAAAGVVLGALALTYVRSVWLAVVVAVIGVLVVTRGGAIRRVGATLVVLAVIAPLVVSGSTGAALTERFDTLGSVGQDESAQARSATSAALIPRAIANPLGSGLGTAGEASRLGGGGGFRYTDNGYLSLLFQVGPLGFLLVAYAIGASIRNAWRNAWGGADYTDVFIVGVLIFFALALLAGDQLFGISGMIFWYTSGLAMRRRELNEERPA